MVAGLPDEPPTIRLQELDYSADLHARNLAPAQAGLGGLSKSVDTRQVR
jgi:hypothetical protein